MNHSVAVGAEQRKVRQLSLIILCECMDWLGMMRLNEALTSLSVLRFEVEMTGFAF